MWAQLAAAALGMWLMAAPAVLGYAGVAATNDRIVGPVAASVGLIAAWEVTRGLRWANAALGAWLFLAPWALGHPLAATVNSVATGALLVVASAVRGEIRGRYGGGWASLLRERSGRQW